MKKPTWDNVGYGIWIQGPYGVVAVGPELSSVTLYRVSKDNGKGVAKHLCDAKSLTAAFEAAEKDGREEADRRTDRGSQA